MGLARITLPDERMGKSNVKRRGSQVGKGFLLVDSGYELARARGDESERKASPDSDLRGEEPSLERVMSIDHSLGGLEELLMLNNPESRRHIEALKAMGGNVLKTFLKNFAQ